MSTAMMRRRMHVEHLVATDAARARLARAAFDAVVDGLDLGPCALRSAADRAWVRVAIAAPIQRAADRALARLVEDLTEALGGGDPALVARILRLGSSADSDRDPAADVAPRPASGRREPLRPAPGPRDPQPTVRSRPDPAPRDVVPARGAGTTAVAVLR